MRALAAGPALLEASINNVKPQTSQLFPLKLHHHMRHLWLMVAQEGHDLCR